MYTQCPECQTVFRITEEQLALAGGRVRCGHCLSVFAARKHKVDAVPESAPTPAPAARPQQGTARVRPTRTAPAPRAEPAKKPASREEMEREIERILSEAPADRRGTSRPPAAKAGQPTGAGAGRPNTTAGKPLPAGRKRAPGPTAAAPAESRPQGDAPPKRPTPGRLPEKHAGGPAEDSGRASRPGKTSPAPAPAPAPRTGTGKAPPAPDRRHAETAPTPAGPVPGETPPAPDSGEAALAEREAPNLSAGGHVADGDDAPLPAALRPPERTGSGPVAVILWSLASLLMLALLGAQYAYHERYTLVTDPTFRPGIEWMCGYLDCRLPPRRDTAAFELQERDVRYHPEYAGALLISGTFVNRVAFAQPYPTVEVVLKDVNGGVVASRRFTPAEYLPGPGGSGLIAPQTEAQLLLEVSDPGNQAVSFEFNFL